MSGTKYVGTLVIYYLSENSTFKTTLKLLVPLRLPGT